MEFLQAATTITIKSLSLKIITFIESVLFPVVLSCMVVAFLWGVKDYVASVGDEKAVERGRNTIIYGIIGIAVTFSVWGLVNLVLGTFFKEFDTSSQSTKKPSGSSSDVKLDPNMTTDLGIEGGF